MDKSDKSDTPNVLALPDIKKQEFDKILELIYKGEVQIELKEYERFVEVAKLLSVTGLKSYYDSSDPNAVEKRGRDEGKGLDEGQLPAENVFDRLFEELECICCFDKMTVPVYQCTNGHLICCKCHVRLRSCPVCREPYSSKPIRNRLAEALVEIANKKEETWEG